MAVVDRPMGESTSKPPLTDNSLISSERSCMFAATLIFRVGAVAVIAVATGYRHSLPAWMINRFVAIAFPLFSLSCYL